MTFTAIETEEFKMTEIGLLPSEWTAARLVDHCSFMRGTEPGSNSYNRIGKGRAFIRVGNIAAGIQGWVFTTSPNVRTCAEEDILMTFDGSPGVIAKGYSGAYSSGIRKMVPLSKIDRGFLYYVLQTQYVQGVVEEHSTGVTIKHAGKALPHIVIPLPPLPEQKKIAYVLSTVQNVVEKTEAVIKAARALKKSLMKHLFTYEPVSIDEAESVLLKETEIRMLPEEWETARLGDGAELITKGASPKWQGFDYSNSGIVFIRSQNVGLGTLHLTDIAYLPKEFNSKEKKSIIQRDDLLINIVGASIGRAAVANELIEGGNLNQAVAIARLKYGFDPRFVMNFLLTEQGQKQLHRQKKEIARANLSLQDIGNLRIPYAPLHMQRNIVEILSAVDWNIEVEENKKQALEALFKTLLSNLMTGKIRVNSLEVPV